MLPILPFLCSFEFFTIDISVRLSDRSLHREEQKKNHQKLPPVGMETRTSRSAGQCLTNCTRQESVGQEISEVSFLYFMTTSHVGLCSFLESIEHDFIKAMNIHLAQLVRHWPDDLEVLVSNPTGGNFWRIFFALSCVKVCQIIWQKRLPWKTQIQEELSGKSVTYLVFSVKLLNSTMSLLQMCGWLTDCGFR